MPRRRHSSEADVVVSLAKLQSEGQAKSGNNGVPFTYTNAYASNSLSEITYYLHDHLGNMRVTYTAGCTAPDHEGNSERVLTLLHAADYTQHGSILREWREGGQEKYLTTHHERDTETGLDYRGARYYDSDVGRFLSLDPLAAEYPAWSSYAYVLGNPISLIDPTGESPEECCGGPTELLKFAASWIRQNIHEPALDKMIGTSGPWRERASGALDAFEGTLPWNQVPTGAEVISDIGNRLNRANSAIAARDPMDFARSINTQADAAMGMVDLGVAAYNGDARAQGQIGGTVATILLTRGSGRGPSLGNPFRGLSPTQIEQRFLNKGFVPKGPDPVQGLGGYVNPKSGYSYHIDLGGAYRKGIEMPHVDVNYPNPKPHNVPPKKKFDL